MRFILKILAFMALIAISKLSKESAEPLKVLEVPVQEAALAKYDQQGASNPEETVVTEKPAQAIRF